MAPSILSFLWCFFSSSILSSLFSTFSSPPFLFCHFSWPHPPLSPDLISSTDLPLLPHAFLPHLFYFYPCILSSSFLCLSPLPSSSSPSSISLLSSIFHDFSLFPTSTTLLTFSSFFSVFRSGDIWPLCITETLPYSSGRYMVHEYSYCALCAVHTMHTLQLLYLSSVPFNFWDVCKQA